MRLAAFALAAAAAVALADEAVVTIPGVGAVQGRVRETSRAFTGIPFALPPVGTLRWQSPEPANPWKETLDAMGEVVGCPQKCTLPPHTCPEVQTEDCLVLNVFTPRAARLGGKKLPVLFFIHGGHFEQGYSGGVLYDGGQLVTDADVVVVTTNYRLGALGFLYSGGSDSTSMAGNFGIQDQRLAMKWVQDNIAAFGGDAGSVTIFGQSAGAMSVATHYTSPASAPFFHRAFLMSEPFGLPFKDQATQVDWFGSFAKATDCNNLFSTADEEKCVRTLTPEAIVAAQVALNHDILTNIFHLIRLFNPWTPTAGSADCPYQPLVAFHKGATAWGQGQDKPVAFGTVAQEGVAFVYDVFSSPMSSLEYDALVPALFGLSHASDIKARYPMVGPDARAALSKIATDALFKCPTRNAAQSVANRTVAPAHVYHFDHIMSFSKQMWGVNYTMCYDAVCHGEDLIPVFLPNATELGVTYTADELVLSASMREALTSFAITGAISSPATGPDAAVTWPQLVASKPASQGGHGTITFETPVNAAEYGEYDDVCDFWDGVGYSFSFPWPYTPSAFRAALRGAAASSTA